MTGVDSQARGGDSVERRMADGLGEHLCGEFEVCESFRPARELVHRNCDGINLPTVGKERLDLSGNIISQKFWLALSSILRHGCSHTIAGLGRAAE